MSRYFSLHVPSSCRQNWNDMVPGNSGRFCLSCQKQVVDFSNMSDAQLANYFKTYRGGGCGKFSGDQINREIRIQSSSLPWLKYFFRIALSAFLLSIKSSAQAQKTITPMEVAPVKPVN